jgi:enolase
MSAITCVVARQILDSRGNPTVEAEVHCASGRRGVGASPSGASTGRHEAVELRDGDSARYAGRSVLQAVANVRELIASGLVGHEVADQTGIDQLLCDLDATAKKSRLGANATLAVSLACAHAAANEQDIPLYRYLARERECFLPLPMMNMISGGLHARGRREFQDFLLLPVGANSFAAALELAFAVYRELGATLERYGLESALVGDEGGYGPQLAANRQGIELLLEAMEQAGFAAGREAAIAIDVASSQFFHDGTYRFEGKALSSDQVIRMLEDWVRQYPLWSIEDGLAEDDFGGWRHLTAALGDRVQLLGDDLFATNPCRLAQGIAEKMANSVLVKLNQIGTLTETVAVVRQAQAAGFAPVISARSGETEDTTIADLAVGTAAGQIKIGCIVRGERTAKYNRLLRIEEDHLPMQNWLKIRSNSSSV